VTVTVPVAEAVSERPRARTAMPVAVMMDVAAAPKVFVESAAPDALAVPDPARVWVVFAADVPDAVMLELAVIAMGEVVEAAAVPVAVMLEVAARACVLDAAAVPVAVIVAEAAMLTVLVAAAVPVAVMLDEAEAFAV